MPIDYKNGKIYKITGGGLTYYGSTCQTLCQRLTKHKSGKKSFENGKSTSTMTSFKILSHPDCDICLVELFPCNLKIELHQRERYYIENNECVNKQIPNRTIIDIKERKKIYKEANKDRIREVDKKYNEANKDRMHQYYMDNKDMYREKKKKYSENNKDKTTEAGRKYREENQDKIKAAKRKYYDANKDKIKEYLRKYKKDKKSKLEACPG